MIGSLFALFAFSIVPLLGLAYAEPLESVDVTVIEYEDGQASIQVDWNFDENALKYEIGCVSCMPNTSKFVSSDGVVLNQVTSFPNSSSAMLYLIAYDSQDEILNAKQLLIDLSS